MTTNKLREVLTIIEDALIDSDVARDLWDVLSALRGPDTLTDKKSSTVIIRSAAFPRLSSRYSVRHTWFGATFGPTVPKERLIALSRCGPEGKVDGHFCFHIRRAADVLLEERKAQEKC